MSEGRVDEGCVFLTVVLAVRRSQNRIPVRLPLLLLIGFDRNLSDNDRSAHAQKHDR